MDCPRCHYHSPFDQTRCPGCFSTFETAALEELGHLRYTRDRLDGWRASGVLAPSGADAALGETAEQIAAVERRLGLLPPPEPPPPITVAPPPSPTTAAPVVAPRAVVAPAAPPAAPPRPSRPAFSWAQVGRALLSERTLNGLLALGAFLILTSGAVISTINPTGLRPLPHFVSAVVTTLLFYLTGAFVRQKLALPRAGATLLAIGAAFIPLAIWILGGDFLAWDPGAIWLVAALVCLPVYLGSHLLLRDRTSALLAALAGGAELLAILAWVGVPPEWRLCTLIPLALCYLTLAARLRPRRPALAWALDRVAQVVVPLALAATLLGRLLPAAWTVATGAAPGFLFGGAVALAWWLGAAHYALAARRPGGGPYRFVTAWTLPIALLLTLAETPIAPAWHNLALALLALGALGWGRWRDGAPAGDARPSLLAIARRPAYQLALLLPPLAALWPAQTLASRVPTLVAIVGVYALAAWLFRQLPLRAVAAYLLPLALAEGLRLADRAPALDWLAPWHGLIWATLAGGYLLFARFVLRAGRAADGTYRYPALLVEPVANAILFLTILALLAPPATARGLLAAALALALVYGAATVLLRQRAWAWVSVALLPLAAGAAFDLLRLGADERPLAWAGVAVALLAAAEIAARRLGEARRPLLDTVLGLGDPRSRFAAPLFAVGYATGALALLLALAGVAVAPPAGFLGGYFLPGPLLAAQLLLVGALVASAATRRAGHFLALAVALFPIPYTAAAALIARNQGLALADADAARLFALLGVAYLTAALAIDRAGIRFAAPLWLAGYGLVATAPLLAATERATAVQTLGLLIVLLAASAWLAHRDRHPTFLALVRALAPDPASAEWQALRALFVYGAAWLFPLWAILALGLRQPAPGVATYGLLLALLAPPYALLGARCGAIHPAYRWPWYLCGYLLAALGPLVALPDLTLAIGALAASLGLWTASAVVSRRAAWLWPVALLLPALTWEIGARQGLPWRFAGLVAVGISLAYTPVGMALHRGWRRPFGTLPGAPGRYARPFFATGQALALLGLALSAFATRPLIVAALALAALGYAALAWAFRQPALGWPATATATAAYVVGLALTPFPAERRGLALLPLLVAALLVADLLRRRLDAARPAAAAALTAWSAPGYALAHGGAVAVVALSRGDVGTLALAWWGVAALHALATALLRRPLPLYPALGAALAALVASARALDPDLPLATILALLVVPAWLLAAVADTIALPRDNGGARTPGRPPLFGADRLLADPWAAPALTFAFGALILATVGAAADARSGLLAALGGVVLLGVCATRWRGEGEAWGALALVALACWQGLRLAGVPTLAAAPRWALLGLVLTLLALGTRALAAEALATWRRPLALGAIGVASWGILLAEMNATAPGGQQPLAITLALTGLTLVAQGFDRRERRLGYAGVAALGLGYMVQLLIFEVGQPQAFALPAGLYLLAIAYLEWRRGGGAGIKGALEVAALVLMLTVTAIQALGYLGGGYDRTLYGSLMLLQAAALFALGAVLHWRRAFLGGALGIVLAAGILLIDPLRSLNSWYLAAVLGFAMIALVIVIEQRRQQIPAWLGAWRARLEEWD